MVVDPIESRSAVVNQLAVVASLHLLTDCSVDVQ
jgi:hypothetical protein